MDFFKLKNMDWFSICAYLYMHFFCMVFYLGHLIVTQYVIY